MICLYLDTKAFAGALLQSKNMFVVLGNVRLTNNDEFQHHPIDNLEQILRVYV